MTSILVLGGTSWLGGAVARRAVGAGHDVTCLARGESGAVPDGSRLVRADRSDPECYALLPEPHDGGWDLVVDVARAPGHVRGAVSALSGRAQNWVFVSSCSVYARHDEPQADESAALLPALTSDDATPEQYGEGKVACEQAVREGRGEAALIARSGLIVGRGDPSERFGYWPSRFARAAQDGGPVLVPDSTDRHAQWVDVEDLSAWLLEAGLAGSVGTVNAVGPATPLQQVLDAAVEVAGFRGRVVQASDEAIAAHGVEEFMGPRSLPLWLHDPEWTSFLDRDHRAAAALGLRARPLVDTVRDALTWERELGLDRSRQRAGLDRSDELAAISALDGPSS